MLPAGFKPATPAIELPQAHALEPSATGIANPCNHVMLYSGTSKKKHELIF